MMTQEHDESQHERTGEYKPFENDPSLKLDGSAGSINYFHSTAGRYELVPWNTLPVVPSLSNEHIDLTDFPTTHSSTEGKTASRQTCLKDYDVSYLWRPRDNRKGRHALLLRRGPSDDDTEGAYEFIECTNKPAAILHGLRIMASMFPYWDISWLLAVTFTVGSLLWIANGCLIFLPLIDERLQVSQHATTWSAFAASTVYLMASILLMLEAINAYKSGCFGWIIERDAGAPLSQTRARPGGCHHRHHLQFQGDQPLNRQSSKNQIETQDRKDNLHAHYWEWWPSWADLRSHYVYELGFIACGVQLVSVFLFWLAKFIAIPEVSSRLSVAAMDGAFWAPEILACIGFIASCSLIMIETQSCWYIPAVAILGWHVGFWKLIGSVGFMVSAVLGPLSQQDYPYAEYHSNLASFWGSCALLIGSLVQWYESLDKNPVIREGHNVFSEYNERWYEDKDAVDKKDASTGA